MWVRDFAMYFYIAFKEKEFLIQLNSLEVPEVDNDELLIAIKDMFDKKVEEVKNEVQDVKRHTGVLVEDLRKDVKAIAEGHSILNEKMDRLETKVDGLETKVDRLETKVDGLETKVDRLEIKVDGLETNMSIVKDYAIGVDTKLNEHEVILKRVK